MAEISAGEPVAWWVHDLHVARQPVKALARYPEPTEFLYPASQEQDARDAAKMLGGKCTPLFAHPAPDTKGPYEARFVDGGMPSDCCKYGVISISEGREVCRVWREQDARAIASALSAFTAGGDDG